MDDTITSKCKKLIVAAIDFGTTYSGYAFSFQNSWSKVLTNNWQGGSLISHKAPTVLLLNREAEFVAFGYEAEDQYAHLTENGTHEEYYLFQRFKMILHQDEVNNALLKDMYIVYAALSVAQDRGVARGLFKSRHTMIWVLRPSVSPKAKVEHPCRGTGGGGGTHHWGQFF